jgi:hypothetical protein
VTPKCDAKHFMTPLKLVILKIFSSKCKTGNFINEKYFMTPKNGHENFMTPKKDHKNFMTPKSVLPPVPHIICPLPYIKKYQEVVI